MEERRYTGSFKEDYNNSIDSTEQYVIPLLNQYLRRKYPNEEREVYSIEALGAKESFAHLIDCSCSIDSCEIHYEPQNGTAVPHIKRFLAHRNSYKSDGGFFNIRCSRPTGYPTEYQKQLEAMDKKYLRPSFHVHAHFKDDRLVVGVVPSDQMFCYLDRLEQEGQLTTYFWPTGEGYYTCYWNSLAKAGIPVITIQGKIDEDDSIILGDSAILLENNNQKCAKHSDWTEDDFEY